MIRVSLDRLRPTLFVLSLLMPGGVAFAAPPDFSSVNQIKSSFNAFITTINNVTSSAINAADYLALANMLWLGFSGIFIVLFLMRFGLKGAKMIDIFEAVFFLALIRVLMNSYETLVSGIYSMFDGVASVLQNAMIGTPDLWFAPGFLAAVWKAVSFAPSTLSLADIVKSIEVAIALFALSALATVLSAVAFITSLFGFWGYSLAKLIGYFLIPTLIFERTSFIFDGWLRFFLGFCVYSMVARLNVAMVAVAFAAFFNIPLPLSMTGIAPINVPAITDFAQVFGLFAFFVVGLFALFSTARFASTIMSGAGGGGIGGAMMSASVLANASRTVTGAVLSGGSSRRRR